MAKNSISLDHSDTPLIALQPISIGSINIENPLLLAPMAGVSDFAFREISRQQGAGLCISEMVTSKTELWHTSKSSFRLPSAKDPEPRPIQIAGADPKAMAEAAKLCAGMGAGMIDINMGCPAKKVCSRAAGSALLADEKLVAEILESVVQAVDVPVTLKTRTGTDPDNKNVVGIARLAESLGVQAITLHGRTRACRFKGEAEYDTIAEVVKSVSIPVIANGDITTAQKAADVLTKTNAAGLMIGRGAWGKPWLFRQITDHLNSRATDQLNRRAISEPTLEEIQQVVITHLHLLYEDLGASTGILFARKHVDRYLQDIDPDKTFRKKFNQLDSTKNQLNALSRFFDILIASTAKAA